MSGFTKLFSTIIHSTVWQEEMHVKVVWVTMLAMANRHGRVMASVPGLASAAKVEIAQCVDALARLASPDPWSRTKSNDGRRIQECDGGWELLNYLKYREQRDTEERRIQIREAVEKHRARKKAEKITVNNVSRGKPRKAQAEAEAEAEAEAKSVRTHAPQSALAGTLPRDHLRHSWCSSRGKCVPDFLHHEFIQSIGGEREAADQRLRMFYAAREHGWPPGPIGDDPVKLWRREFAASFPSVAPAESGPSGRTAMLQAATKGFLES